jgi:hypothetical protein
MEINILTIPINCGKSGKLVSSFVKINGCGTFS